MKIHEYQAKKLLGSRGVPVPRGGVASTAGEARAVAQELGGHVVLKAQVHAGGRGQAGGVRAVVSADEAARVAETMLGANLVTYQTGPAGVPVRRLLVEEWVATKAALYTGLLVDGAAGAVTVVASDAGGVDVEQVARERPERIFRVVVDPAVGLLPYQGRKLAYAMGLEPSVAREFAALAGGLYGLFVDLDCSLVEVNPLVVTAEGRLLALDAKMAFDDDALFQHPELVELRDPEQEDPTEARAGRAGISFVKLQGDLGCIVNGAGLAMATMDVAMAAGARPANFLDVGGGADEEKVAEALGIVLSDPGVKRVLVNIFGGILRCDTLARGLVMGAAAMGGDLPPMVVRLRGTNAAEGRAVLEASGLRVTLVDDLRQAAEAIRPSA